jgi:ribonuclease VapC
LEQERFVLDSYALVAFLEGEQGQEEVERLLKRASEGRCQLLMSVVNLGEVVYITQRERGLTRAHEVLARVDEMPIRIVDADRRHALAAAHIKAQHPVAYADCFAASLSQLEGAVLVTGDPEFRQLEAALAVPITWLGAG